MQKARAHRTKIARRLPDQEGLARFEPLPFSSTNVNVEMGTLKTMHAIRVIRQSAPRALCREAQRMERSKALFHSWELARFA